MKFRFLLVALLLMMVFPQAEASTSLAQGYFQNINQQLFMYNFSAMSVGSSPANNSWITFNTSGGNNISYSVQNYDGKNGLNVETTSYDVASFLNITMNVPFGYSLNFNFSWSDQQSGSFTEDNFLVSNSSSSNVTTVRFGPFLGFRTQILQEGNDIYHEQDIPFTGDSLNLSPTNYPQDGESYSLSYGNANSLPVIIPGIALSGNTSIAIGGDISNLTIYSISMFRDYHFAFVTGSETPKELYSEIPSWLSSEASWNSSLVLPEINTMLIPCNNGTVIGFNYENVTFFRVAAVNITEVRYSFIQSFVNNGSSFFLYSGIAGSYLISIGCNLQADVFSYNGSLTNSYVVFGESSKIVAFSPAGILLFSYNFTLVGNLSLPAYLRDFNTVSSTKAQGSFSAILTNFTSESRVWLNDSDILSVQNLSFPVREFWNNVTLAETVVSDGNISSELVVSEENLSYNSLAYAIDGSVFYSTNGEVIPVAGTSYLFSSIGGYSTSGSSLISFSSGGTPLVAAVGADSGNTTMIVYGSEIAVVYQGSGKIIAGSLSVTFPSSILIRGDDAINFTINSTSFFEGTLEFGGHSFKTSESILQISASGIPSGNYSGIFNVTSEQGFTYSQPVLVSVDQYDLAFTLSLANKSYVSTGTVIYYNVTEPWMVASTVVSYAGNTIDIPAEGALTLSEANLSGNISLNFTVTDCFGYVFHFNYSFRAVLLGRSNFTCDLPSGYVSLSSEEIHWTNLSWASYYIVTDNSASNIVFQNSTMVLFPEGNTTISISARSVSGFTVWLFSANVTRATQLPVISLSAEYQTTIERPCDRLFYSITDPVSLSEVTLLRNGIAIGNYTSVNGSIDVNFTSNGQYNFTLLVTDACGNTNSSQGVVVQNLYFANVVSSSIVADGMFSQWGFTANLAGNVTPEVKVQWVINGRITGNGTFISVVLPVGKNYVEMIVTFDGRESITNLVVYNYGYMFLVAPLSGFSMWGILYLFAGRGSEEEIRSIIISSKDKSLREVYRTSRRLGYNRVKFKKVLRSSIRSNEIVLLKDPDGNSFVMDPKT